MRTHSQAGSAVGGARALLGAVLGTGLVLTLVAAPASTEGWRESARRDGVVVSELALPGRPAPTFRGVGLVETDLATVLSVIQDADRHPEWLHDCTESRMLLWESERVSYLYHRTNVSWPLSDRDVILRTEVDVVEPGRLVFVRFRSEPDMVPPVTGIVRVEKIQGFYRLEALAPRRTSVEYRVDVEPLGSLPGWIQRRAMRALPLETVLGLRRQSTLVDGERVPLLMAEPEGVVNPSATAGVVASEAGVPMPVDGVAGAPLPESAAVEAPHRHVTGAK